MNHLPIALADDAKLLDQAAWNTEKALQIPNGLSPAGYSFKVKLKAKQVSRSQNSYTINCF